MSEKENHEIEETGQNLPVETEAGETEDKTHGKLESELNEEQKIQLVKLLSEILNYAKKVNENIIAFNESRGILPNPGFKRGNLLEMLKSESLVALLSKVKSGQEIQKNIDAINDQNPRTVYDTDIVDQSIQKIEELIALI